MLFIKQPVGNVDDFDTFVDLLGLTGTSDEELGVGVANVEEVLDFASESLGVGDVVGNLNIKPFVGASCYKVDFAAV